MKRLRELTVLSFLISSFVWGVAVAGERSHIKIDITRGMAHGRGYRKFPLIEDETKTVAHERHLIRLKEGRDAEIPYEK
jgi:phage gp45-like